MRSVTAIKSVTYRMTPKQMKVCVDSDSMSILYMGGGKQACPCRHSK